LISKMNLNNEQISFPYVLNCLWKKTFQAFSAGLIQLNLSGGFCSERSVWVSCRLKTRLLSKAWSRIPWMIFSADQLILLLLR
ncbi:MAG: hypothetical protein SOW94_11565, partial [Erysipelotrichaceae bacterium]|nr:hypothetical protein [Erysipelotrichaceae bacterium]